jgi:HEAT repeat protein
VSVHPGWHELLTRVSAAIVDSGELADELSADAVAKRWLGSPGGSAEELAAAEERLGRALPPGYRAFLSTSNGFGPVSFFIRRLRPITELVWLRDEDPELIEAWCEGTGESPEESALSTALAVGDKYDGARVLLNPTVVDEDGEWEAWFFAHWVPGAETYGSFRALVEATHAAFIDDLRAERGEPTPRVAPTLGVTAEDREGLIAALQRPRPDERAEALRGLANLRDPTAAAAVVAVLQDETEDDHVRQTAARTLGQLREEHSAAALLDVLRLPYPQGRMFPASRRSAAQERVIGLKHAARQGLLQLGPVARPLLAAALLDPDPLLRAEACQTLCYDRARPAEAYDLVSQLEGDQDPDVRLTLVTHLEQLPDPRRRALLRAALRDGEPRVRAAAAHALELIGDA